MSQGSRIPALDGLRGVSILAVLAGHACGTGALPRTPYAHVIAEAGVRCFFVISGFLITTLLVQERARAGGISLRGFYARRARRIFPAFYAFLAVVSLLALAGVVALAPADLAQAATYTMDFRCDRPWLLGHLWSLSVEEQFYLIWPLVVVVAARRAPGIAIAALVIAPLARLAVWYGWLDARELVDVAFPCVFDALAMGCVLALARRRLEHTPRYVAFLHGRWLWPVALAGIAMLAVSRPWFSEGIAPTLTNAGLALAVHRCVSARDAIARALVRPTIVWIGTLSYSLYLWQQVFVDRAGGSWCQVFPVNIALAAGAAYLSYRFVERPLRRPAPAALPSDLAVLDLSTQRRNRITASSGTAHADEKRRMIATCNTAS
jgi:peptidoglycan/LPS O-acetylase OafA/YrhL